MLSCSQRMKDLALGIIVQSVLCWLVHIFLLAYNQDDMGCIFRLLSLKSLIHMVLIFKRPKSILLTLRKSQKTFFVLLKSLFNFLLSMLCFLITYV